MVTTQSWTMDSESNVFFLLESWVDLNQYLGIRLSRELILSQVPGNSLESWVDLNQYLGIAWVMSWLWVNFLERRLRHELNWLNLPRYRLSHEVIRVFFWRRLNLKPPKMSHEVKSNRKTEKGHTKWNQFSHELIWINIPESKLSRESIWIKILKSPWVLSWFE